MNHFFLFISQILPFKWYKTLYSLNFFAIKFFSYNRFFKITKFIKNRWTTSNFLNPELTNVYQKLFKRNFCVPQRVSKLYTNFSLLVFHQLRHGTLEESSHHYTIEAFVHPTYLYTILFETLNIVDSAFKNTQIKTQTKNNT